MKPSLARASALIVLHGLLIGQQPFHWQVQSPGPAPAGVASPAIGTYQATSQRALWLVTMFPANRTFEWSASGWIDHGATPVGPLGVTSRSAIAHDPTANETLIFGGFDYPVVHDLTYAWTGTTWAQASPVHSPTLRRDAGMFFDEVRQHLILVAGTGNNGIAPPLPALDRADTWEWSAGDWVQLSPVHQPTAGACLVAYDSARGRAVLLPRPGNSMWEWDGSDWSEVVPSQMPPLAADAGMVFDASRGRVLLQAGGTWEWDGVDWYRLTNEDPPSLLPIVYDAALQRSMRVAGPPAAVWLSQNVPAQHVATATPYGSGCGSPALQLVVEGLPLLGQISQVRVTPLPVSVPGFTTSWVSAGFSQASGFAWPTPQCEWLHSSEVVGLPCNSSGRWSLAVPYNTSLLDFDLYLQGVAFAPGQNDASLVLSNAVHWHLGDS